MRITQIVSCTVLAALLLGSVPAPVAAQGRDEIGASDADVNCTNFLSEDEGGLDHAQAVFEAAGGLEGNDPYQLDGDENQLACDDTDLGTEDPATCQNFQDASHAQALLDAAGRRDPYGLDPDGNGVACDGGGGGEEAEEPLDGPPPETSSEPPANEAPAAANEEPATTNAAPRDSSRDSVAIDPAAPSAADNSLEARLEAQFAAFEARAANGFGMFPDSDDESDEPSSADDTIAVDAATSPEPVALAQPSDDARTNNQAPRGQQARDAGTTGAETTERQTARNNDNSDRDKENKNKNKNKGKNKKGKRDKDGKDGKDDKNKKGKGDKGSKKGKRHRR